MKFEKIISVSSAFFIAFLPTLVRSAEPTNEERIFKAGMQLITVLVLKHELERDANCKHVKKIEIDLNEWLIAIPKESASEKEKADALKSIRETAERMKLERPKNSDKTFSQQNYLNTVEAAKKQNSLTGISSDYCDQINVGVNNIFNKAIENARLIRADGRAAVAEEKKSDEELRKENLRRMAGMAPPFKPNPTVDVRSYGERLAWSIKPNIAYAGEVQGNPVASVEIKVADDGKIIGVKLEKSSGVKEWDEAVLKAVIRTASVPLDSNGKAPNIIMVSFRPRE